MSKISERLCQFVCLAARYRLYGCYNEDGEDRIRTEAYKQAFKIVYAGLGVTLPPCDYKEFIDTAKYFVGTYGHRCKTCIDFEQLIDNIQARMVVNQRVASALPRKDTLNLDDMTLVELVKLVNRAEVLIKEQL